MKIIPLALMLLLFSSCKDEPKDMSSLLQSRTWRVSGWPGQGALSFKESSDTSDWQASFSPEGRLSKTYFAGEPQFDAHGNEVVTRSNHTDSCYTYEIRKEILKISSHGHAPPEDVYFFKIVPGADDKSFQLTPVSESEFK